MDANNFVFCTCLTSKDRSYLKIAKDLSKCIMRNLKKCISIYREKIFKSKTNIFAINQDEHKLINEQTKSWCGMKCIIDTYKLIIMK